VPDDPIRETAEALVRAHDEDPAFRAVVAVNAPRVHAVLARDRRRRARRRALVGVGLTAFAFAAALLVRSCAA
jgi:hypothetical protein